MNMIMGYFEMLLGKIDIFLSNISKYIAPNGDFTIFKYAIAGLFFLGFLLVMIHINRNDLLKQAYVSTYEKQKRKKLETAKDINKIKEKVKSPIATYMNNKFIYSRIDKYITFMTPALWFAFEIILFIATLILLLAFKVDLLLSFIFAFIAGFVPFFVELLMAHQNYKKEDKQLVEFLNMIGNYSLSSGEITDVFAHVYPMVDNPIRDSLEECIYEAENLGSEQALINLANKIEHPKFKEIIQNLRVAQKYSGNFRSVVENNNAALVDYIKQKRERDHLATFNMISLVICLIITVFIFIALGQMINTNVFEYLVTTTTGQICLLIAAGCVGFFIWKIYTIDK